MSNNPTLNRLDEYEKLYDDSDKRMSISGTLFSLAILGVLLLLPALISWHWFEAGYIDKIKITTIVGSIVGFILAIIISFKPKTAPFLTPIYAVSEGAILGGLSAIFEATFPHIVIQAVAATFATLFSMLALYKTGLIRVTERFKSTMMILLFSIALLYLVALICSFFNFNAISQVLWYNSPVSIGISCVIIVIAALSLLLDFDRIERFAQFEAPAYMNWYCAFGLLVTLVWLYIEFLRLLSKLSSRR